MRISDWSSDVCSSDLVFEQFAEHAECGAVVERLEFVEVKMHGAIELRKPARGPVRQAPTCRTRRAGFFTGGQCAFATQRFAPGLQLGRASCRERVWQYV